jgi:steroid delta-isomerase-like uncharacterized protein
MSAQDNAKLVRAIYDMYNERDIEGIVAQATANVEVVSMAFGASMQGLDGYRQYLQSWATAFPDSRVEVSNVVAGDQGVVVEFRGKGKHTGPLAAPQGEIPPTGKSVDVPFCDVYQIKAGKVASLHNYFDSATMMRQLGLIN